ncbi:MAG: RNA polymerase sigma factor [Planctomycetes bacterium]|nr:RNA polymerase sigma factor [Planctomycetota bacterium]
MEDWLLIIRCKRGDTKALGRIYEKYKPDCLLLAMSLVNDSSAAEDIWHDVFLRFAQGIDRFRLTGRLKGFFMTCVANQAKNYLKAQRRSIQPGSNGHPKESGSEPLNGVILNEQVSQLAAALAVLPNEQREVIMLHVHGRQSFASIANTLGMSRDTIKSRYRYGMQKLQTVFQQEVSS